MSDGRFICTGCLGRHPSAGDCPTCIGEPLMDLHNESVRLILSDEDDRVARARHYRLVTTFAMVGFVLSLPLMLLAVQIDVDVRCALLPVGGMAALGELAYRLFPPRRVVPDDIG